MDSFMDISFHTQPCDRLATGSVASPPNLASPREEFEGIQTGQFRTVMEDGKECQKASEMKWRFRSLHRYKMGSISWSVAVVSRSSSYQCNLEICPENSHYCHSNHRVISVVSAIQKSSLPTWIKDTEILNFNSKTPTVLFTDLIIRVLHARVISEYTTAYSVEIVLTQCLSRLAWATRV